MTTADVQVTKDGAVLRKDGKKLQIENLSHPELEISIISLYPAPLKLDKQIENLKRLEIRIPAWILKEDKGILRVRLTGE